CSGAAPSRVLTHQHIQTCRGTAFEGKAGAKARSPAPSQTGGLSEGLHQQGTERIRARAFVRAPAKARLPVAAAAFEGRAEVVPARNRKRSLRLLLAGLPAELEHAGLIMPG